ncbi:MAG: hypothetical protein KAT43_03920 [Nanoarchaeota archaeon]|nr:hypothetical protein [Nanoarchaeota archaeon]
MNSLYNGVVDNDPEKQSDLLKRINAAMEAHEEHYGSKNEKENRMRLHEELFAGYVETL